MSDHKTIVLHLGNEMVFEVADPLMSWLESSGKMLFYRELTTVRLPRPSSDRRAEEERSLVGRLRGRLEAYAQSPDDRDYLFRIVIVCGQPADNDFAGYVNKTRDYISNIFGADNKLLKRICCSFIFTIDQHTNIELGKDNGLGHQNTIDIVRTDDSSNRKKLIGDIYVKQLIKKRCDNAPRPPQELQHDAELAIDNPDIEEINVAQIVRLHHYASKKKVVVEGLKKSGTSEVRYIKLPRLKSASNARENNSYLPEHEKRKNKIDTEYHVPHFLDDEELHSIRQLTEDLDELRRYELKYDFQPYFLPNIPKQTADGEEQTATYNDLETEIEKAKKDLDEETRKKAEKWNPDKKRAIASKLQKQTETLHNEFKKLCFLKAMLWLLISATVLISLAYFTGTYNLPTPKQGWTIVCIAFVAVLSVFAVIAAFHAIKKDINAAYKEIQVIIGELDSYINAFKQQLENQALSQANADVIQRNIKEMQDKFNELYFINKKVELWSDYYEKISDRLENAITMLSIDKSQVKVDDIQEPTMTIKDIEQAPNFDPWTGIANCE